MRQFIPHSQALCALRPSIVQPAAFSCRASSRPFSQLARHNTTRPSPLIYLQKRNRLPVQLFAIRHNSDASRPGSSLTDRASDPTTDAQNEEQNQRRREQEPAYRITFTCKPCGHRSSHRMSKHGYHRGTVLISCPSCSNRHVISDHLNIFFDKKKTLDDILKEQGSKVTHGYENGDMEFWDDGSVTNKSDQETKS